MEHIRDDIDSKVLQPGDQLPSERELSDRAGISRMTVRQAVAFLARDGTLEVRPGVGTFVAEPKLIHDTLHLLGFTEEMLLRGERVSSRVLEQTLVDPPPFVSSALQLTSPEKAVKIVRLRLSTSVPLLLETSFVPAQLCPGLESVDLESQSLYGVLEGQYGLTLESTRQTVEATVANEYEVQLLQVEPGTAMILLQGVTYADNDKAVEYVKAIYRGDRFKLEMVSQKQSQPLELRGARQVSVLMNS